MLKQFYLALSSKILIPKEDNSPLINEKRQFIQLSLIQLRQLHILEDSSNRLSQVNRLRHRE